MQLSEKNQELLIRRGYDLAVAAIRGAVTLGITYWVYHSIDALAGQSTEFKSVVNWALEINLDVKFLIGLAITGWGAAFGIEKLRQRTIRERSEYIKQLEARIDPRRTSSELSDTGQRPKLLTRARQEADDRI